MKTGAKLPAESRATAGELMAPHPVKIRLNDAASIRREMCRVYRAAKRDELDVAQACRLSYMLGQILKAHELTVVEERIRALESTNTKRATP